MVKVGIIGGEMHIGEITKLRGEVLEIVAASVRPDQVDSAKEQFGCDVLTDHDALIARDDVDVVAVANANDERADVIVKSLAAGRDVVADKPLAIVMADQERIEATLREHPERRLLNLLTLRGDPLWAGMRDQVRADAIGTPAFTHVRMAVQLKRAARPPWFLDSARSGGLFLDLLIHGLDYVEWVTGARITAVTARMGNLGNGDDPSVRDHAGVFCELDNGGCASLDGQRMLPDTKGSDYRVTIAGTKGCADLLMADKKLIVTSPDHADREITGLPAPVAVAADWLEGGELIPQDASLRANRLALWATLSARDGRRIEIAPE